MLATSVRLETSLRIGIYLLTFLPFFRMMGKNAERFFLRLGCPHSSCVFNLFGTTMLAWF
jgi:hypothetical protein